MTLPPIPTWDGAHVLVVHFPVALLLVAPLMMFLAILVQKKLPGFAAAAWVMLFLGTVAAWVAVSTGMAAYEAVNVPEEAQAIVDQHKDMAHNVKYIFTGLCVAYGFVLLVPVIFKRVRAATWRTVGTLVILAVYGWAAIYLANTAHLGGRLVHEFDVHPTMAQEPGAVPATTPGPATMPAAATKTQ